MKRVKLYYIIAYPYKGAKGVHIELNLEITEDEMKQYIADFEQKNRCECNYHYGYLEK